MAQFDFFREAKEGGAGPAASPQPFGGGAGAGAGGATVHHVSGGPGTGDAMTTSGPPRKKDGTSSENALFCTCQQPSYGDMVACDGEDVRNAHTFAVSCFLCLPCLLDRSRGAVLSACDATRTQCPYEVRCHSRHVALCGAPCVPHLGDSCCMPHPAWLLPSFVRSGSTTRAWG